VHVVGFVQTEHNAPHAWQYPEPSTKYPASQFIHIKPVPTYEHVAQFGLNILHITQVVVIESKYRFAVESQVHWPDITIKLFIQLVQDRDPVQVVHNVGQDKQVLLDK
jgi:hypothetical protein